MICFRLSSTEYEQFLEFCSTRGASSVSELARAAVSRLVGDPSFESATVLEARVNELERRLRSLTVELKKFGEGAGS